MQITFVSNYINHHQIPLSDELYRLSGGNYTFIQTEPMEEDRIRMGWAESITNLPYVKLFYEEKELCKKLIFESDCVIFGGCEDESVIMPRLEAGRFTIRYSERLYREGRWKFVSPRGLIKKYHDHIRFRNNDVYLLCAGAYVKGDFSLIHAYPGKMFKFGYFPKADTYTDVHGKRKDNNRLEILWAARFLELKHPEVMVELGEKLKRDGINFHITMIGDGEAFERTKKSAASISDVCEFCGMKTPQEVREAMRKADVFVTTSDKREGWGAVVNESMNSGCVCIASREIGAAPYLIEDGKNGFLYKACDTNKLVKIVEELANDRETQLKIGMNAYNTITEVWNPEVAAARLYEFMTDEGRNCGRYEKGPLSRA